MPDIPAGHIEAIAEAAVAEERRKWVEWLQGTGYPFDWGCDPVPPCSPEELAQVWVEREVGEMGDESSVAEWTQEIRLEGRFPQEDSHA